MSKSNNDPIELVNQPEDTSPTERTTELPAGDYTVIAERLTGTVKWFNNKAGFGFITVCEPGEYNEKDIFVHYTSIRVSNSQYKYLVQGEYVDFTLVKANSDGHEFQAMDVSGVKGGPIMCETRRISMNNLRETPHEGGRSARSSSGYGEGREGRGSRPPPRQVRSEPRMTGDGGGSAPAAAAAAPTVAAEGDNLLGFTKVQKKRRSGPAPK
jgi:cold shock CspA family protein